MAYMSQEHKKELAPGIKSVLKKYNVKGSISVDNKSSLIVTLKQGKLDIVGNHNTVIEEKNKFIFEDRLKGQPSTTGHVKINEYHIDKSFNGEVLSFLQELHSAMNVGNFDKSDYQTDYFHIGWYTDISVGKWDKGYQVT